MRVRLTQIDGKLPNLALMKLAHWHQARGDDVFLTRRIEPDLLEGRFDRVYGSAIFSTSQPEIECFKREWPDAILGGTASGNCRTVEEVLGVEAYEHYDYDGYDFGASLGFTARGCRFSCPFCAVPGKEGKPRAISTINAIWRGGNHPKTIHLLDNDFFGQPRREWLARLGEIADGDFEVCFNQGINVRVVNRFVAEAIAEHLIVRRGRSIEYRYRDDDFARPRLYTAWDNIGDERVFFRGVDELERAGIPPYHLMAYMLVGFDPAETPERVMYRFDRMVARGIMPYPMVYDALRKDLKAFQRFVLRGIYRAGIPFAEYDVNAKMSRITTAVPPAQMLF